MDEDFRRLKADQDAMFMSIVNIRNDIAEIKSKLTNAAEERGRLLCAQEEILRLYEAGRIWSRVFRYFLRLFWYATIGIGGYAMSHWAKVKMFIEGNGK